MKRLLVPEVYKMLTNAIHLTDFTELSYVTSIVERALPFLLALKIFLNAESQG